MWLEEVSKPFAQQLDAGRPRQAALQVARRSGATHTVLAASQEEGIQRAMSLTNGRGYDRVIETGGVQATLDLASAIAAEYGRLILAGYHQDGLRTVNLQQWNWRALDVVNAHERSVDRYASGMAQAVAAVLDGAGGQTLHDGHAPRSP